MIESVLEAAYYAQSIAKLAFEPMGIVYAGAHVGEHIPLFRLAGFTHVLAIEPNPAAFRALSSHGSEAVRCVQGALGEARGTTSYYDIEGIPTLNSTLEPDLRYFAESMSQEALRCDRIDVETFTLDDLLAGSAPLYNALYMNIQGGELSAIAGGRASLKGLPLIITEVNFQGRYKDCPLFPEVDRTLEDAGYTLMQLRKYLWSNGEHGEAWYIQREHMQAAVAALATAGAG